MAEAFTPATPDELIEMSSSGFSPEEIDDIRIKSMQTLASEGFSKEELEKIYGTQKPDMEPMRQYFKTNLAAAAEKKKREPVDVSPQPVEAEDFIDNIAAGWSMSVAGLVGRGDKPSIVTPEHAPMASRIASQISTLAGDFPAMVAGFVGGTVAGTAAGTAVAPGPGSVVGGTVGGMAGANALPAAVRSILMQHYEKGDIRDFKDFYERSSAVLWETTKAGVIGAATGGAGAVAGKALAPVAGAAVQNVGKAAAEISTMVTVGSALEGEVPRARDFVDAAIVVGGLAAAAKVGKFRNIYERTGIKPEEIMDMAQKDPVLKQEILSNNIEMPQSLNKLVEPGQRIKNVSEAPVPDALNIAKQALDGKLEKIGSGAEAMAYQGPEGYVVKVSRLLNEDRGLRSRFLKESILSDKGLAPKSFLVKIESGESVLFQERVKPLTELIKENVDSQSQFTIDEFVNRKFGDQIANLQTELKKLGITDGDIANYNNLGIANDGRLVVIDLGATKFNDLRGGKAPSSKEVVIKESVVSQIKNAEKQLEQVRSENFKPLSFGDEKPLAQARAEAEALWVGAIERLNKRLKELEDGLENKDQITNVILTAQERGSAAQKIFLEKGGELKAVSLESVDLPPLTDAQTNILNKIKEQPSNKEAYNFKKAYKDYVDKLNPAFELEKEALGKTEARALPTEASGYKQMRLVGGFKEKTKAALEDGLYQFKDGKKTGTRGLLQIATAQKDLDGFVAYVISKRAIDLEARGIKSGFDLEAAKKVAAEGTKFEKDAREFVKAQHETLKYFKDSGRISQETYDKIISQGENYVPLGRILDESEAGNRVTGTFLKEIKGSDADIQNPILTAMQNTERAIKLAEINRATTTLVDFAQKNNPEALIKVESKAGVLGKDEFEVWRDGKREVYKAADADLAQTVKELGGNIPTQNFLLRAARFFTAVKRFGITNDPGFLASNAIRDQATAATFSKTSRNIFLNAADSLVALGDVFKKNDKYYAWLRSGGAGGEFFSLDELYLKKNIYDLNKETKFLDNVQNVIMKPVEIMGALGNAIEKAPRLAEFKRSVKAGRSMQDAAFASREITVDFQRIGAKMAAMNSITAFLNVNVQGLDRLARAARDNPKEFSSALTAYVVAPSVLLWWANQGDERVKEVPRWQKDHFWILATDDWQSATEDEASGVAPYLVRETEKGLEINRGVIYRVPKPQGLGLVGSAVERVLEKFVADNPDAMKEIDQSIQDLLVPSLVPDAIRPVAEHFTKTNWFTGRPIVPQYLEKELPYARYTDYTSETAKALGKMLQAIPVVNETYGASPMVIENYVRGWGGTLGTYALQLADAGLIGTGAIADPVKPEIGLADIPGVKSFIVRFPSTQAQSVQDFYDAYEKVSMIKNTLRSSAKRGDEADVELITSEYGGKLMDLEGYKTALTRAGTFIKQVHRNPDITPVEKRQLIETTYFQMIEIARQGLVMVREVEKSFNENEQ